MTHRSGVSLIHCRSHLVSFATVCGRYSGLDHLNTKDGLYCTQTTPLDFDGMICETRRSGGHFCNLTEPNPVGPPLWVTEP